MGKRLNRTVRNWRWWVVTPLVPFVLALIALQCASAVAIVFLIRAEQFSRAIFNWSRKGTAAGADTGVGE